MVRDPSIDANSNCNDCHSRIVKAHQNSLHVTLAGEKESIIARSGGTALTGALETAFNNHCSSCHASCGDCHISVPTAAGGGLLKGHVFKKTPPMTLVCTACHGSRVSDEYKGQNQGVKGDIHYSKGMQCTSCHTGNEMHGVDQDNVKHRYQVANAPKCADCHPDDATFKATTAHTMHRDANDKLTLSCQVCHSGAYKNCSSCHVQMKDGHAIYEVNAPSHESLMTFKIAKNPAPDALHPEKWIVVRHVPIDPDNYAFYGQDLLTTFDARPTWNMATPHNIQKTTTQNAQCTASCHGKRELFLGPNDLESYETAANANLVVSDQEIPQ